MKIFFIIVIICMVLLLLNILPEKDLLMCSALALSYDVIDLFKDSIK